MLNLSIAMLQLILFVSLLFQNQAVSISSPQSSEILRGQVEILGDMDVAGFVSGELAFGYMIPEGGSIVEGDASGLTDSWFNIQIFSQPKVDGALATWDTPAVTDGDYQLRLRVYLQDGSFQDALVTDLKIRNDSPAATETPVAFLEETNPTPMPSPDLAIPTPKYAQPTSSPANPASLTVASVYSTFGRGALMALGLFLVFSYLLRIRKKQ